MKSQHWRRSRKPVRGAWSSAVSAKRTIGRPTARTRTPWDPYGTPWPGPPARSPRETPQTAPTTRPRRAAPGHPRPQGPPEPAGSTSLPTSGPEDGASRCLTEREVSTPLVPWSLKQVFFSTFRWFLELCSMPRQCHRRSQTFTVLRRFFPV